MDDLVLAPHAQWKTTPLEQLEHGSVFRKYLCDKGPELGCTGNTREMAHQCPTDATPLILVDHDKGDLGLPRLNDNITSTTRDRRPPFFIDQRN